MASTYQQLVFSRTELLKAYEESEQHCDNPEWASKRNTLRAEISKVTKELMDQYNDANVGQQLRTEASRLLFKLQKDELGGWRFDIYSTCSSKLLLLHGKTFARIEIAEEFIQNLKQNALTAIVEFPKNIKR